MQVPLFPKFIKKLQQSPLGHSSDLGVLTLAVLLFYLGEDGHKEESPLGPRSEFGVVWGPRHKLGKSGVSFSLFGLEVGWREVRLWVNTFSSPCRLFALWEGYS